MFQPVLPVVMYTGDRSWPTLGRFADGVAGGPRFAALAPSLEPVFVNLRDTPQPQLVAEGGAFGQVLRLLQQRHAGDAAFRGLLRDVVQTLERLPGSQRMRWLDLLSYIHALVYHEREGVVPLQQVIEDSVQTDPHRQEVRNMGKSYAMVLEERGALRGRREMFLQFLRVKFGELPAGVVATVEACTDVAQFDRWSEGLVKARRLADVGIPVQG